MIHLKFIHTLLGVLSLSLFVILAAAPPGALPVATSENALASVLLLATAVSNLFLGCYISRRYRAKRQVQMLASILTALSVATAMNALFNPEPDLFGYSSQQVTQILLVAGVTLHFIINLNSLNPYNHPIENDASRETGTVKWFNVTKGFGFITRDMGDDVFVHYRAIRGEGHRTLTEGQRVDFMVVENSKGLQAEDVIAAARGR